MLLFPTTHSNIHTGGRHSTICGAIEHYLALSLLTSACSKRLSGIWGHPRSLHSPCALTQQPRANVTALRRSKRQQI